MPPSNTSIKNPKRAKKYFGRFKKPLTEIPNLVTSQVESFEWLIERGLKEVFEEFSSIKDFSAKKFQLDFVNFELVEPKFDEYTAKNRKVKKLLVPKLFPAVELGSSSRLIWTGRYTCALTEKENFPLPLFYALFCFLGPAGLCQMTRF